MWYDASMTDWRGTDSVVQTAWYRQCGTDSVVQTAWYRQCGKDSVAWWLLQEAAQT